MMASNLRSSLLFGLAAIVGVALFSFVPSGALLVSPVIVALVGAGAGYLATRQSAGQGGIRGSVLAGGVAGIGALIGALIFFALGVRAGQMETASGIAGGLCFGVLYLLMALACGALGGWLAARKSA
jgi:hypothetical protein